MKRRFLIFVVLAGSAILFGPGKPFAADGAEGNEGIVWHDVQDWGVEGRAWTSQERKRYFDRFPAKAESTVRPAVWSLSRDSSGMSARFKTDAKAIHVRYTLLKDRLAMPHMPATGVSGIDLYGMDAEGQWRWVEVTRPAAFPEVVAKLGEGLDGAEREYMIYLPLYNGVESLEIGIPEGASFEPIPPRKEKPIVFYGTSITHGACASRPGMTHPAILGRRLDRPVINAGFSGNGKMEKEVGDLLVEIDAAVYVIDCLPNMTADLVAANTELLVRQIRAARPGTPIVLVEDRTYGNSWIRPSSAERHKTSRAELRKAYEKLVSEGVTGLFYLEGADLLGDDDEGTTDGSHPSDLGFFRQANAFEPVLRKALR